MAPPVLLLLAPGVFLGQIQGSFLSTLRVLDTDATESIKVRKALICSLSCLLGGQGPVQLLPIRHLSPAEILVTEGFKSPNRMLGLIEGSAAMAWTT